MPNVSNFRAETVGNEYDGPLWGTGGSQLGKPQETAFQTGERCGDIEDNAENTGRTRSFKRAVLPTTQPSREMQPMFPLWEQVNLSSAHHPQ